MMESVAVVYQRKERVTILADDGKDYLVRDEETGKTYYVDHIYFRRHYEATPGMEMDEPIHTEVWAKLHQQAEDLHKLKRANTNLRNELKTVRRANDKLRKEAGLKQKDYYRNGQKRGSHGRHG